MMRRTWIRHDHNAGLVVFMNGWGMDACVTTHTPLPDGWDMLMFYDYSTVEAPMDLADIAREYDHSVLIAWSMGVWAAGPALAAVTGFFDHAVAVNGTAEPIDERFGIPPEIYGATLDGFCEETRGAFYRRMCHSRGRLNRFLLAPPRREAADQRRELQAIQEQVECSEKPLPYPFGRAIIGKRDRIMRPENQERFWEGRTPFAVRDMPHYPFADITWKELLSDATGC
jgi:pimeloyl-[acyl-carrier protein] methyl ester esterase